MTRSGFFLLASNGAPEVMYSIHCILLWNDSESSLLNFYYSFAVIYQSDIYNALLPTSDVFFLSFHAWFIQYLFQKYLFRIVVCPIYLHKSLHWADNGFVLFFWTLRNTDIQEMTYLWTVLVFIFQGVKCNAADCIDFVTSSNVKYSSRDIKTIKLNDKSQGFL